MAKLNLLYNKLGCLLSTQTSKYSLCGKSSIPLQGIQMQYQSDTICKSMQ